VVFAGEYDLRCKEELRAELERLNSEPSVTLDFTEVTFIDSTCTREIVRLGTSRQSAVLPPAAIVVKPGSAIRRLFDIVGLAQMFRVAESIDDVLPRNGATASVRYAFSGCLGSMTAPFPFEPVKERTRIMFRRFASPR
jgi:anti-anti-sigma factor